MSILSSLKHAVPVLQIIHVSDLHVVLSGAPPRAVRSLKRALRRAGLRSWWEFLEDGTAGHDTFAPFVFSELVARVTVRDPVWSNPPTWLVDTGDQTTFGDPPSIAGARGILAGFANAARPTLSGALANLPGNHDAWPDGFP